MNKFVITKFVPKEQDEETIVSGVLVGQPREHKIKLALEPSDFEGKTYAIECSGYLFDKEELLKIVDEIYRSRPNASADWMDFANEMEKRLKC